MKLQGWKQTGPDSVVVLSVVSQSRVVLHIVVTSSRLRPECHWKLFCVNSRYTSEALGLLSIVSPTFP